MKYYDNLNKVIDTIEKQLTSEINYDELAKIVGISSYSLQRTFSFLTGMTLTEYIRKRRLSKSAEEIKEFKYRIVEMGEQEFYGITTGIIPQNDSKSIQALYIKSIQDGTKDFFIKNSNQKELYYGIYKSIIKDGIYTDKGIYYIAGKTIQKGLEKVKIPKGLWICFTLSNKNQQDINQLYDYMYTKWLPNSKYKEALYYPQLEIYYEASCEICIAIEKT